MTFKEYIFTKETHIWYHNCILHHQTTHLRTNYATLTGSLNHGSKAYPTMILFKNSLLNLGGIFLSVGHLHGSNPRSVSRHSLEATT